MNVQSKEREPLPPEVVDKARRELAINADDARRTLRDFDPSLMPSINQAIEAALVNRELRKALNRLFYVSRNSTFAMECTEQLAKFKQRNSK